MKDYLNSKRNLLYLFLMSLLVFPFLQSQLNIFELKPLKGDISNTTDTTFTFRLWFNGDFQEVREAHLNESFGFRNLFVRLNNQVAFSLFKKANAKQVIVGKENVLYEESYIKSYFGADFSGEEKIADQVNKLKFLQDTLAKLNKSLILVFAPGKGFYFPEFIPDKYQQQTGKTNIDYWLRYSKEANLNAIDYNSYFMANKNLSEYPLYPRNGIHWSQYGACLAADSLVRYMEKLRGIDMTNLNWNSVQWKESAVGDRDIADGLNLLLERKPEVLAYPDLVYEPDSGKTKPSAIVISDSFYWTFVSLGFQRVFSGHHFWYYNRQIHSGDNQDQMYIEDVDLLNEIKNHDIILIMGSTPSLCNLGWGFIDHAYDQFRGINSTENESLEFKKKVRKVRSEILKNEAWMETIKMKAQKNNVSIDSMVTLDAIWLIKNEKD
jgi:hypothetical protein